MAARARVGSDMWGRCGIRRARGTRWAGADNLCRRTWWAVWSWTRRSWSWSGWAVWTWARRAGNWWAVRTRALRPWMRNWWQSGPGHLYPGCGIGGQSGPEHGALTGGDTGHPAP